MRNKFPWKIVFVLVSGLVEMKSSLGTCVIFVFVVQSSSSILKVGDKFSYIKSTFSVLVSSTKGLNPIGDRERRTKEKS